MRAPSVVVPRARAAEDRGRVSAWTALLGHDRASRRAPLGGGALTHGWLHPRSAFEGVRRSVIAQQLEVDLPMSCDMNGPHKDRVILITGAGGGVGRGYALLYAQLVSQVAVLCSRQLSCSRVLRSCLAGWPCKAPR